MLGLKMYNGLREPSQCESWDWLFGHHGSHANKTVRCDC